jgi:hypothetical protein
MVFPDDVGYF